MLSNLAFELWNTMWGPRRWCEVSQPLLRSLPLSGVIGQGWEDSEGTLTHHPICVLGPGLEELKTRFCLIPHITGKRGQIRERSGSFCTSPKSHSQDRNQGVSLVPTPPHQVD